VAAQHETATHLATGTTGSANVSKPTGTVEGDLLLAFHNNDVGDLVDMGTPTGGETWQAGLSNFADPGPMKTWWKFAGASEPSTYGFTQDAGADGAITIVRVSGADPAVDPVWFGPNQNLTNAATINTPASTPIGEDDLEYRCALGTGASGTPTWFLAASTPSTTALTNVNSGDFANHRVFHRQLTSSSATTALTATSRNPANTSNIAQSGSRQGITVVIKSASTTVTGTMDVQLPALQASGAGTVTVEAGLDATLPALQADMAADVRVSGGMDAALPALTAAFDGSLTVIAELGAVLPALDFSGVGDLGVSGVFDATLPALQAAGAGVVTVSGGMDAELPALSFAGSGVSTVSAALNATLPALEFAGQGEIAETVRGTLSVVLPALQADMAGSVVVVGEMDATLPALIFTGAGISYVSGYTIGAITGPSSTTEPTATGPAVRPDLVLIGPAVRWDSSGPAVRYGATGPSSTTEPTATGPASNTEPTATGPAIGRDVSGPAVSREISGVGV
jgi:hypothetical protein